MSNWVKQYKAFGENAFDTSSKNTFYIKNNKRKVSWSICMGQEKIKKSW